VEFAAADFFVMRAAMLPIESLHTGSALRPRTSDQGLPPTDTGLGAPEVTFQAWIRDPLVQAAIYIGSPSLSKRLTHWLSQPTPHTFESLRPALFRYFLRMTTRATPFGLFASFSTGRVGPDLQFELGPSDTLRRHSSIDLGFIHPFCRQQVSKAAIRRELCYVPNTTLIKREDGWQYVDVRAERGQSLQKLVRIESTELLDRLLESCAPGLKFVDIMVLILSRAPGVTRPQADHYLNQLIDSQILVSTLAPTLTGQDPVRRLIDVAAESPALAGFHATLQSATERLTALDANDVAGLREEYEALAQSLVGQLEGADGRHVIHVDLHRETPQLSLPRSILPDILGAVEVLRKISPGGWPHTPLQKFRDRFADRYGDRVIELVTALDEESGIGFEVDPANRRNEGLLSDFKFEHTNDARPHTADRQLRRLIQLVEIAWSEQRREIQLSDEDVTQLMVSDPLPLPDLFTVFGSVIEPPNDVMGDRPCFLLSSASQGVGPMGRFCRSDAVLNAKLEALLRNEEALRPDAIFAEIVHLPDDRAANIISHPDFRAKDLVYLGESGLKSADQILLSDLTVSVEANRIILRSQSLGREVLPRKSNAHNASGAHASVYRFLAALALQDGAAGLSFSWGTLFGNARFLPRVCYGRVVLCPALWRIDRALTSELAQLPTARRQSAVESLRVQRGIPRWIQVGDLDNWLSFDLDNPLCVDALIDELGRSRLEHVRELVPQPDEFCLRGPKGHHAHEVMIPFLRRRSDRPLPPTTPGQPDPRPRQRRFAPGSDWLYAKVYGSLLATEQVLLTTIADVVRQALTIGAIDRWHFVRYRDTDDHLRLRFHGNPEALRRHLRPQLERLFNQWTAGSAIWRCQWDTYEREVHRYGGSEAIEIAEEVFHADSELVGDLLRMAPVDGSSAWRWKVSMKIIDIYHNAFGFDLPMRQSQARFTDATMRIQFGLGKAFEGQLSRRYRKERRVLESLLDDQAAGPAQLRWVQPPLIAFNARLEQLAARFFELAAGQQLTISLQEIVRSLTHMHVNRMMLSNAREHELIIHASLNRLYQQRLAQLNMI